MTYRTPFVPETDQEIEALAELSRVNQRAKLWTIIPLMVLTTAAIVTAVYLHVAGELTLHRLPDGSYLISKGSICAIAAVAGLVTFIPGWLLGRVIQLAVRLWWRASAARRFKLDAQTLHSLERMFA